MDDHHPSVVAKCGHGQDMTHSKHETRVRGPLAMTANAFGVRRTPFFPLDVTVFSPGRNVGDMLEECPGWDQEGLTARISAMEAM
jgi:hypothetical protein